MANYKDLRYVFPASSIASGTFDDARIAASNVSQHAQSFDDNKIVNDISTLALRQASNENKSAYNTNSMYIDVFQDSSGMANTTNAARDTVGEYVSSIGQSLSGTIQGNQSGNSGSFPDGTSITHSDGVFTHPSFLNTNGDADAYQMHFDLGSGGRDMTGYLEFKINGLTIPSGGTNRHWAVTEFQLYNNSNSAIFNSIATTTQSKSSGWNIWNTGNTTSQGFAEQIDGLFQFSDRGFYTDNADGVYTLRHTWSGSINVRYIKLGCNITQGRPTTFQFDNNGTIIKSLYNATGSFENNAITAPSSVSSMGAIITYQDNAGTNALNTDIVLQLSADGGSNYTTATLTAMPDFDTGIKMAKVNDLSVTAGTSLKYKISFANQASGTKEARIRGVSLQY